ncbi:MAG: hypothetical protein IAE91_00535 [Ignavibacteriaceae bacterium]|nr:hypothetical protein [Ignavibacteriaceae bacterium]
MNYYLEIVAGSIIAGMLLFILIQRNLTINNHFTNNTQTTVLQRNLTEIANIMDFDFRKTGYRVTDSIKISLAGKDRITVRYDANNDGVVDSVSYYLEGAVTKSNPSILYFFRKVNNEKPVGLNMYAKSLKFNYYDVNGKETTFRSRIRYFKVTVIVESPVAVDNQFPMSYWEKIYMPRNL